MKTAEFCLDYVSNNACLAWSQLQTLTTECVIAVRPQPVLYAGMLSARGTAAPPSVQPAVGLARLHDGNPVRGQVE